MSDRWTCRFDEVLETYDLVSPAGRHVAEVFKEADARSLCDLLNDGLVARQQKGQE